MRTDELDYDLPPELVAQRPAERRDESRLLVYDRATGDVRHRVFRDVAEEAGDALVVLNDTRVLPARLRPSTAGRRGGRGSPARAARRRGVGGARTTDAAPAARHAARRGASSSSTSARAAGAFGSKASRAGEAPLPPYITEPLGDPERYQTVYAERPGSAAAPTAGLHFTPELLARLDIERVTLHVGLDTFRPVSAERLDEHEIHSERYEVEPAAWERIRAARRVLAVGTTTTRVLESLARGAPTEGRTDLFITPGFEFRRVDALLTNFHLPRSTLLALVMAFAGVEETRAPVRGGDPRALSLLLVRRCDAGAVSHFQVTATDGAARTGILRTAHGDVPTPAFMPVGTKATVKGLHPDRLRASSARRSSSPTRTTSSSGPGAETIEELGGLHRFMGWDGPILTDSGGFQVFSLRHTIAVRRRRRHVPLGLRRRRRALHAGAGGGRPAAARLRRRHVPRRLPAGRRSGGRSSSVAVERTTAWARRQLAAPRADGPAPLRDRAGRDRPRAPPPLDRGDRVARLRRARARRALASARTATRCSRRSRGPRRSCRPSGRATSWGSATRSGSSTSIERGVDMFDCVLPTRLGRTAHRAHLGGTAEPEERAASPATRARSTRAARARACERFSRAYLRHLVRQQELLGLILLSEHNVRFLLDLTAGARDAIERRRVRPVPVGRSRNGSAAAAARRPAGGVT